MTSIIRTSEAETTNCNSTMIGHQMNGGGAMPGSSGTVSPSNYSNSSTELETAPKISSQKNFPMSQSVVVGSSNAGVPMNLVNRNLSRSTGNLRKHSITSVHSESASPAAVNRNIRRAVSPSPKRAFGLSQNYVQNGPVSPGPSTPSPVNRTHSLRHARGSVSGSPGVPSTAMNGAMKKWVSSQDFYDSTSSPSSAGKTSGGGGRRFFGSSASLATSAASLRSLANIGFHKEPVFNANENILQIFVRGRPVNLLAPSATESNYNPFAPNSAPSEKLKLDWIYGYRGKDCRSNLHLLPTGEIVYFTATVAILYNHEEKVQRHYVGHTDDIKCIAIHPNRLMIATGQLAKGGGLKNRRLSSSTDMDALLEEGENLPHVRVWDSITLQTQHVLGIGDFERAVSCVAFSKTDGGALLAAVDESYEHTLSIWDWQRKKKITETKSANDQVFSCEFHPTEKHLLVTCGKSQISFWIFDGLTLQKKMGIFEGREKPKYVLCVCFSEWGEVLSGDSNGTISVWDWRTGRVSKQAVKAHQGGVFAICSLKGGKLLSGGGRDRRILEWSPDLKPTGRSTDVPDSAGPVRTLNQGKGNLILIGSTHNAILQGSLDLGFSFIAQGHLDELWGLCSHPVQQQFLTCGYDKTIRLWDSISHSLIWVKEIADPAYCSCFHPNGSVFVVGTTIGRWLVLDSTTRDVVIGQKDGNDIISALSYSSDGRMLAVASHDGNVYMYSVTEDARHYNRIGKCGTHASFVTAVDWSDDGQFIRTNSGDHEVLFWHAVQCKPVQSAASVRDVNWAGDSCSMSFKVFGAWPEGADGTEINGCARSTNSQLLAVAEDSGLVKLFKYPSSQPKSCSNSYSGHSSHVTSVSFLANDSRLISIGGKDSAIFQWAISK